jgi:hypothetical protein
MLFVLGKNYLISGRSLLLYLFPKRVIELTNNYNGISLLSTLYNILLNILPSQLINICLNETYNTVHISKHLSDSFPIQTGLKMLHSHCFPTFP